MQSQSNVITMDLRLRQDRQRKAHGNVTDIESGVWVRQSDGRREAAHKVLEHDRLTEHRPVVDPAAAVSVPACTHLLVEGAIHLVLLSAKDLKTDERRVTLRVSQTTVVRLHVVGDKAQRER